MHQPRFHLPLATLMLLVGPLVVGQEPAGGDPHRPFKLDLVFRCQEAGNPAFDLQVDMAAPFPVKEADLEQVVELPGDLPAIRLRDFLPSAERTQRVEPVPEGAGQDAVEISITGSKYTYTPWLVAGDPARRRMNSLIGSWEYVTVGNQAERDRSYGVFSTLVEQSPTIIVGTVEGGERARYPAREPKEHQLEDLGYMIHVLEFLPHFTSTHAGEASSVSDKLVNPAVRVRIEKDGKQDERWVFARFPDYKKDDPARFPLIVRLDSRIEGGGTRPAFVVARTGDATFELWTRDQEECTSRPLPMGEKVAVPRSGYEFAIANHQPNGRLVEEYKTATHQVGALSVLRVEVPGEEGPAESVWLEVGKPATVVVGGRTLMLGFRPRGQETPHGR